MSHDFDVFAWYERHNSILANRGSSKSSDSSGLFAWRFYYHKTHDNLFYSILSIHIFMFLRFPSAWICSFLEILFLISMSEMAAIPSRVQNKPENPSFFFFSPLMLTTFELVFQGIHRCAAHQPGTESYFSEALLPETRTIRNVALECSKSILESTAC